MLPAARMRPAAAALSGLIVMPAASGALDAGGRPRTSFEKRKFVLMLGGATAMGIGRQAISSSFLGHLDLFRFDDRECPELNREQ